MAFSGRRAKLVLSYDGMMSWHIGIQTAASNAIGAVSSKKHTHNIYLLGKMHAQTPHFPQAVMLWLPQQWWYAQLGRKCGPIWESWASLSSWQSVAARAHFAERQKAKRTAVDSIAKVATVMC
ncbi:MAG: hypothetical protein ACKERG_01930 [Candidatus Hodgkinia cicadicola]